MSDRCNAEGKRAEPELPGVREELEIRVQERTAELTVANEALRAEIAKRREPRKNSVYCSPSGYSLIPL